jgi:hypothetical protein
MQRVGRSRRTRRVATIAAIPACALAAAATVVLTLGTVSPAPDPAHEALVDSVPTPPLPMPPPAPEGIVRPQSRLPRVQFAVAETTPGIVEKYTTQKHAGRGVIYIGDGELSRELGAAGHDPGVIRTPTEVIVVAGPELARGGS